MKQVRQALSQQLVCRTIQFELQFYRLQKIQHKRSQRGTTCSTAGRIYSWRHSMANIWEIIQCPKYVLESNHLPA